MTVADVITDLWPGALPGWPAAMQSAALLAECTTADRAAMFVAQCGHECAGFTRFIENLNYSAQALIATWPKRFTTMSDADRYARNPVAIGNRAYADRLGNGPESSGDGYRYRGRGPIQITGRVNYEQCGAWLGLDLIADPEQLTQPDAGSRAAAWFWRSRKLNEAADVRAILAATKLINGGDKGLAERTELYQRARRALAA